MQLNDSSSGQKIVLKCKPLSVLRSVSSNPSPEPASGRRSTRIASRSNENLMEAETSNGKIGKQMKGGAESSTGDDDDGNIIVRSKKRPNKRRSQNRIEDGDDEDDDFVPNTPKSKSPKAKKRRSNSKTQPNAEHVVETKSKIHDDEDDEDDDFVPNTPKTKSPKPKKRRSNSKVKPNADDVVETKIKTPVKKRKPLLAIKCNKITDYFGKSTKPTENEAKGIPDSSVPVTHPSDVIVLSSSEEQDDNIEQVRSVIEKPSIPTTQPPQTTINLQQSLKQSKCPAYKIVDGTNFAVDAFRFGEIAGVSAYFLTHFHSDHYDGLNRKFNQPIYMSTITGRLVKAILKVNAKLVKTMNINTTYIIDGVEVTPVDANHCPGAVMFIFKLSCGRTILHTGDFRATPDMESNPVFWNNNFSTIYLDTTYLHKSYNFCTQNDALLFVEDEVKKFQQKNVGKKFVIVVGSYVIGKERVWSHIAQTFNMKVWLEDERRKALELIYKDENECQIVKDCISDVREGGQVHVIPIRCVNYAFLMNYLKNFEGHSLLAFRPTGWAQNMKPQYGSSVSIVGVQYSEHSSYSELERFVRFLQPTNVIATVPMSSGNPRTRNVPNSWLAAPKPMTTSQRSVTSFMKVRKSSCSVVVDKLSNRPSTHSTSQQQKSMSDDAGSCGSMETDFMP